MAKENDVRTETEVIIEREYTLVGRGVFYPQRSSQDLRLATLTPDKQMATIKYSPTDMNMNLHRADFANYCARNGIRTFEEVGSKNGKSLDGFREKVRKLSAVVDRIGGNE